MSDTFDLGGSGSNSFPFEKAGDSVTGTIIAINETQQTDVASGKPAVWQDGKPKMMLVVELATPEGTKNRSDDGTNTVYVRGAKKPESQSSLAAVIGAVKTATGGSAIAKGATLTLTYVGDGAKTNPAFSAPKKYMSTYVAPNVTVTLEAPVAQGENQQYLALLAAGIAPDAAKAALGL